MRKLVGFAAFLIIVLTTLPVAAQRCAPEDEACRREELRDYIKANYTKYDYMAPMRDGVRLFVSVYAPKDTSKTYPIWMLRTPYSVAPYGADNYPRSLGPSEFFTREGYIFAYSRQARQKPGGRGQRHLRYDRLSVENHSQQQWPSGHLRHVLPRILRHHGDAKSTPGAEGRLAPGSCYRVVHRG